MGADGGHEGWVALVSTPIGNLEDITLRALRVLREADLIAAEDTRRIRKLCSHYDIKGRFTSYHAHNEHKKTGSLLDDVESGLKLAVVSNAGTPAVSDPGFLIVREAVRRGIEPVVIPGASALTFAVVACGLPVDSFCFSGFLPRKSGKRRKFFESLKGSNMTHFVFVSVHRVRQALEDLADVLGTETYVVLIREATKVHEERLRGAVGEILREHGDRRWKGEIIMGIDAR
jgi:16S rRNA (cytidine1402-2'-O)-methyltransferase